MKCSPEISCLGDPTPLCTLQHRLAAQDRRLSNHRQFVGLIVSITLGEKSSQLRLHQRFTEWTENLCQPQPLPIKMITYLRRKIK